MTWLYAITEVTQAPDDTLRVWAIRADLCALTLALLSAPLVWRLSRSRSWHPIRSVLLLVDALPALTIVVYAAQAWTSYQWFSVHHLHRSYPSRDAQQAYTYALSEALAHYQLGGWTLVGVTVAILIGGTVMTIRR